MRVLTPDTVDEACEMLARSAVAPTPIAGATDLLVNWPERVEAREVEYLDLSGLDELRFLRWDDDALTIGAMATYWDVVQEKRAWSEFPMLVQAARQVGAVQIQSRGTWAGNIVNASPGADGVPVLMAYDAMVALRRWRGSPSREETAQRAVPPGDSKETARRAVPPGVEEIPLSEFYLDYKKMRRRPDQLITEIRLPRREYDFQVFEKVGARRAQAIAKVGLAMAHSEAGWRIVAASMAPTVRRCAAVEQVLESGAAVRSPDDLLPAIRRDVSPIDDIRSTGAYREMVMARLLYHDLKGVCPGFV